MRQYMNRGLELAHGWDVNATWDLWIATDSYDDMPKRNYQQPPPEATKPLLIDSYKSPWVGETVEKCAKWLQAAPEDTALLQVYFTVMNEFSKEDDNVITCRVNIEEGTGNVCVDYYPVATKDIATIMMTNRDSYFYELGGGYQARMKRDGKPDQNQGGPFN